MGESKAEDLPKDDDGNAIRLVLQHGSSLDKPMVIDFHVAAISEETAHQIAEACAKMKYHTDVDKDENRPQWTVTCSTRMILTYDAVIAVQDELHAVAQRFQGYMDGWGTFGNFNTDYSPPE